MKFHLETSLVRVKKSNLDEVAKTITDRRATSTKKSYDFVSLLANSTENVLTKNAKDRFNDTERRNRNNRMKKSAETVTYDQVDIKGVYSTVS